MTRPCCLSPCGDCWRCPIRPYLSIYMLHLCLSWRLPYLTLFAPPLPRRQLTLCCALWRAPSPADMLTLRSMAVGAGMLGFAFNMLQNPPLKIPLYWGLIFLGINSVQAFKLYLTRQQEANAASASAAGDNSDSSAHASDGGASHALEVDSVRDFVAIEAFL